VRSKRLITALMGVVVLTLLSVTPALAASGSFAGSGWSGCSHAWTTNSYGGEFRLDYGGSGSGSNSTVTISSAFARVSLPIDCGPAGNSLIMPRVELTTTWIVYGTSSSSCTVGLPPSFSCTRSSTATAYSYLAVCTNRYDCRHDFSSLNFYSGSGGNFNSVYMQVSVNVSGPGGTATMSLSRTGFGNF
jgi:hypothetical protein